MENRQDQDKKFDQGQGFEKQPQQSTDAAPSPPQSSDGEFGGTGQSDTATKPQTDVEGGAATGQATDSGFVGSDDQSDTSSELVEDNDPDFAKDGQGSIE